jgi:GNAT superfamily N-acetyltransferase
MEYTKLDDQLSGVVRRMTPNELGQAVDVWYRSLLGSISYMRPEQLRSEEAYKSYFRDIVATTCELWIAELEGRVVGVLALQGDEIHLLYVAPEAQGQGFGTALLEHAKTLHPNGLTLVTHERNVRARRFYEQHGFEAKEHGMSLPPESEPDVKYVWSEPRADGP